MISAHFAPAFVIKAARPDLHLGWLMACCYSNDLLHFILCALGKEKLRGEANYSHSLLGTAALTAAVFVLSLLLTTDLSSALAYTVCAASHFIFDLLNHRSMPVLPHWGAVPGLGWYCHERKKFACLLEWVLFLGSWTVYFLASLARGESIVLPIFLVLCLSFVMLFYFRIYEPMFFERDK
jgi:hypothetical protein